jgi:hypothetical protein
MTEYVASTSMILASPCAAVAVERTRPVQQVAAGEDHHLERQAQARRPHKWLSENDQEEQDGEQAHGHVEAPLPAVAVRYS